MRVPADAAPRPPENPPITGCNTSRPSATEERLLQIDYCLIMTQTPHHTFGRVSDSLVRTTTRLGTLRRSCQQKARYKTFIEEHLRLPRLPRRRYFINTATVHNAMRALFLQGHIRITTGEPAIHCLSPRRRRVCRHIADHLYLGKNTASISGNLQQIGDTPQETEYAKLAYKQYQKLDSLIFIQESALDYGLAQCRNEMSDKGLPLINKILKMPCLKTMWEMATTSLIYLGNSSSMEQ